MVVLDPTLSILSRCLLSSDGIYGVLSSAYT